MDLDIINSRQERLIIHADALRATQLSKKELIGVIVDVAKRINVEIKEAHKNGLVEVECMLPITFDVSNMTNANAQRQVYFTILKWLEWRKYRIQLKKYDCKYSVLIKWLTPHDEQYAKLQMSYLENKMNPI